MKFTVTKHGREFRFRFDARNPLHFAWYAVWLVWLTLVDLLRIVVAVVLVASVYLLGAAEKLTGTNQTRKLATWVLRFSRKWLS